MARPTKLTAAAQEAARDYIKDYAQDDHAIPTVGGLAERLGVAKRTIRHWKKRNEEFENTYERLMSEQERVLLNKGITGEYNAAICKLILMNNHGYRDKKNTVFAPFGVTKIVYFDAIKENKDENENR